MNDNRLLKDNYIKINHIAAKCMRFFVALIVALWAFAFFSRECNLVVVTICMVLCCIFSLIPTLVIDFFKHDRIELCIFPYGTGCLDLPDPADIVIL